MSNARGIPSPKLPTGSSTRRQAKGVTGPPQTYNLWF
jgi:hypothetical protein